MSFTDIDDDSSDAMDIWEITVGNTVLGTLGVKRLRIRKPEYCKISGKVKGHNGIVISSAANKKLEI